MATFRLRLTGSCDPTVVKLDGNAKGGGYLVRVGDDETPTAVEIDHRDRGLSYLRSGSEVVPYCARLTPDGVEVWLRGALYRFDRVTRDRAASHHGADHAAALDAPMPGLVRQVLVRPGQKVDRDQPLVVLESMKMEMTLTAPVDATVSEVVCSIGQMVRMAETLVRFEHRSEPA